MSTRDKKLLIILAGVAILALTYFFIFVPQSNKRDSLKSENMNLKSQYNQLSALAAKADDYTKKTKDMSDAMQQVYDNFPSYLQIENGIMDAVAIEKSTNTNITELTVGSPTAIDVNNPTGEAGTDSSSGSTTDSGSTDSSTTDSSKTVRRALRPLMATVLSHRLMTVVQLVAAHHQALQSLRLQAISFMMSAQLWHSRQNIMGLRLCSAR